MNRQLKFLRHVTICAAALWAAAFSACTDDDPAPVEPADAPVLSADPVSFAEGGSTRFTVMYGGGDVTAESAVREKIRAKRLPEPCGRRTPRANTLSRPSITD